MKNIRVYIVEDDPMVLEVNKGFLQRMPSFTLVGEALTGEEALKGINDHKPDLILLDMFLPDLSGVELLLQIREKRLPSDVIMITAARDTKTIHEIIRLGAVDYLVKPFRFDRFQAALENYQKMWSKLMSDGSLKQTDIDELKGQRVSTTLLPKGLSDTTLKQIMNALSEQNEPITAEQLASVLGMARVTVRRYLEFLEQEKKIKVQVHYGSVGRPSHYYSL